MNGNSHIYSGDIVAGSLMIPESRIVAGLLRKGVDNDQWHRAIVVDNLLQKRSPVSAKRQARLIKDRLSLMPQDFWELIEHSSHDIVKQALLAAAIKHSRLLGDFLDNIVRDHWRTFQKTLNKKDWEDYLNLCAQKDPYVENWTESTKRTLRQVVFRILAESSYIDGTKTKNLLPVIINTEVRNFLIANDEKYVLNCMESTG